MMMMVMTTTMIILKERKIKRKMASVTEEGSKRFSLHPIRWSCSHLEAAGTKIVFTYVMMRECV